MVADINSTVTDPIIDDITEIEDMPEIGSDVVEEAAAVFQVHETNLVGGAIADQLAEEEKRTPSKILEDQVKNLNKDKQYLDS